MCVASHYKTACSESQQQCLCALARDSTSTPLLESELSCYACWQHTEQSTEPMFLAKRVSIWMIRTKVHRPHEASKQRVLYIILLFSTLKFWLCPVFSEDDWNGGWWNRAHLSHQHGDKLGWHRVVHQIQQLCRESNFQWVNHKVSLTAPYDDEQFMTYRNLPYDPTYSLLMQK